MQASKPDRPSVRNIEPKKHAPRSNRRSLPAYISPRRSRITTAEHDITSVRTSIENWY